MGSAQYRLTIVESTRYTTLVAIEQTLPAVSYWSLPSMTVRLYHDAMVAEVCSSQQIFLQRDMIILIKSCINATKASSASFVLAVTV